MRKLSKRAFSVLLLAFMVIAGLCLFIYRDYTSGKDWAEYFSAYNSLSEGEITDREGYVLAYFKGAKTSYAGDPLTRTANYHVTGDFWGRTGTGLITKFYQETQDFNFFTGTTETESVILKLSIDSQLNNEAYRLLRSNGNGCIMLMNYRTGEVLCMVSSPSTDPEDSDAELEDGTYINRCISASFVPGSTFKLITAAAAIENIPDIYERKFTCCGESEIAGVPITCTAAHGEQSFEEALANSCNCAFADITVELGQETMVKYVKDYGFLSSGSLEGITTASGTYPEEFVGDPELAWSGIGQSTDSVCPYTMLCYVAAIANGGELARPTLLAEPSEIETDPLVKEETAAKMQALMRNNVVTHYEGEVNFPNLPLCAKTGTAELGDGTSHSWFTGFLLDEEHPYAFVALVERGGYGLWTAGLMMNELLQTVVNG